MSPMQQLYTPEEVAELLKVGKTLVYQLLRANKLTHSRVGNRYRVSEADLQAYLDSTKSKPAAETVPFTTRRSADFAALRRKHFGN